MAPHNSGGAEGFSCFEFWSFGFSSFDFICLGFRASDFEFKIAIMSNPIKEERLKELIKHLAGKFFSYESNYTSLITITNVAVLERGKKAKIFFTVFPEEKEKEALDFAKRKRSDFREYFKKNSDLMRLPFVDFEIDRGEKNRQRLDEISREA